MDARMRAAALVLGFALATVAACDGGDAGDRSTPGSTPGNAPPPASPDGAARSSERAEPPAGDAARALESVEKASPEARSAAQTPFDVVDQDKDGKVDVAEAAAVPGLDFESADKDMDAALTPQEYLAAIALNRPRG